ncbi:MAG: 3-methyl-2-oxobutanoate hydroxymethyltransferase [Puniceicoccales bacterium]|jgi:3-methyl-2-oxobutanoate hydroxymethyltransferase|nr:3-methyl-2-oxobutanoate hydroxymethyltransferase [Puniceicoccales bacterium]
MKATTKSIRQAKGVHQLACLTAYDTVTARIADEGGADLILVGDSMGNTVLGFENSVPVTLDMVVHHTAAVARARVNALVVADVPFGIAHDDFPYVLRACMRLMQVGAEAVKIEGGVGVAPLVARLVAAGIPVCGHVGLQPQQVFQLGGYKKFGGQELEADAVLGDACAVGQAGAFAVVGEMLTPALSGKLRRALPVPLIGIGSGEDCDGQILVIHDLLGLTEKPPGFVRPFANLGSTAREAVSAWAMRVRCPSANLGSPKAE